MLENLIKTQRGDGKCVKGGEGREREETERERRIGSKEGEGGEVRWLCRDEMVGSHVSFTLY